MCGDRGVRNIRSLTYSPSGCDGIANEMPSLAMSDFVAAKSPQGNDSTPDASRSARSPLLAELRDNPANVNSREQPPSRS